MALFDAVDRERVFGDLQVVPGNVDLVFHAQRDSLVNSRWYFGHCGVAAQPPCRMETMTFVTTHAGMGGVPFHTRDISESEGDSLSISPWVNVHMEADQSFLVHRWMWANLRKQHIVR